jgi:hypothetical protein
MVVQKIIIIAHFVNTLYNLSFVLNGCEAWSLISGEEQRLAVFENVVLRISALKMEQAANCVPRTLKLCILI